MDSDNETYNSNNVFLDSNNRKSVIRECDYCGEEHKARLNDVKGKGTNCCSKSCSGKLHADSVDPQPDDVEIPDGRDWEEMPASTRYYYKNRSEEIERLSNDLLSEWVNKIKNNCGCYVCDENLHPVALDFHHVGEKQYDIAKMVKRGYSKRRISEEMKKCLIVCSNCHRKVKYLGDKPRGFIPTDCSSPVKASTQ